MEFSGRGFISHSGQLSTATSQNPSVVNTICINSLCCRYVVTCARFRLKQMWQLTKAMAKLKHEHWTKRWNWSSCTKLALSACWTHDLTAQLFRASEWNSVVVGSNPTQPNFLQLQKQCYKNSFSSQAKSHESHESLLPAIKSLKVKWTFFTYFSEHFQYNCLFSCLFMQSSTKYIYEIMEKNI